MNNERMEPKPKSSKKGCLIGCGVVLAIFVVIAIVLVVKLGPIVKEFKDFALQAGEVAQEYQTTNQQFPFVASEEGLLERDRFDAFMGVRRGLLLESQDGLKNFENMVDPAGQDEDAESAGFAEMMSTMLKIPLGIARIHVGLLRQNQMSLDEYRWNTACLLMTISQGAEEGDEFCSLLNEKLGKLDQMFAEVEAKQKRGQEIFDWKSTINASEHPFSEANVSLLKEYEAELTAEDSNFMLDMFALTLSKKLYEEMAKYDKR